MKKQLKDRCGDTKYPQIKGRLKNENGYCCLGVLLDVIDPSKWNGDYYEFEHTRNCNAMIPDFYMEKIGLRFKDDGPISQLSEMNDQGCDFKKIAEIIRTDIAEE